MGPQPTQDAVRAIEGHASAHAAWLKQMHFALFFGGNAPAALPELPSLLEDFASSMQGQRGAGNRRSAMRELHSTHQTLEAISADLLRRRSTKAVDQDSYLTLLAVIEDHQAALRRLQAILHQALAHTDWLTGTRNRHGMAEELQREWTRSARTGQPCCVALVDLDHFKAVNDQYGHSVGDTVLSLAGQFFARRLRPYDLIYRYGGEEFLFCLPNTDLVDAEAVLNRLRALMARLPVKLADGRIIPVTVSIGVAPMDCEARVDDSIEAADRMLYVAKQAGRNRIRVAHVLTAPSAVPRELRHSALRDMDLGSRN